MKSYGYAAHRAKEPLRPFAFERRELANRDVALDVLYCGVCHSDLHQVRDEWGVGIFPMVPGHEMIGRVTAVGSQVSRFKPGDLAGVGVMVDSCRKCESCQQGLEQYCEKGCTFTYNSPTADGQPTYGGYARNIVADDSFVLRIPGGLDPAAAAPLLCAGITTYSPLRHWRVKGQKVGVVGLGGLGHLAVKFAHAMGARVVLFTTSEGKAPDALRFGADEVVISTNENEMKRHADSLDFIVNAISAQHNLNPYLGLLKRDGVMALVGLPDKDLSFSIPNLSFKRRQIAGTAIGGIAETQEMLDFCANHGIVCDIELIPIQKINEAFERMSRNDVKYRFVIDLASLRNESR
ncbi:MAG: NAD(P)-dependent alcohol dehydrogenase [Candidatus Binataceae bacterium]|nr:NAD(P)-dependent alcohol dehydrogenase [Candidatus Binataceae bacterium]